MKNETFRQYVSNWLDGSLTEAESAALQSELEKSRERRDEFVDLCGLDADLRLIIESAIDSIEGASPNAPFPTAIRYGVLPSPASTVGEAKSSGIWEIRALLCGLSHGSSSLNCS